MGMYLMRQIGTRGVYGNPLLPDDGGAGPGFANPGVWLARLPLVGYRRLPVDHHAGDDLRANARLFPQRHGVRRQQRDEDFGDLLGWDIHQPSTRRGLYIASVLALGLGFLLCRYVTSAKLGRVLLALRDAESRVRFFGYSVTNAKLFVFTVSAVLAGLAGALYVPQVGIINPSEFSPDNSIEIAMWVAVGGRGTLVGAIVGAVLVNAAKTWLTSAAPETWLFVLGAMFILTTLVFPHGIVRLLRRPSRIRARAAAPVPAG